MNKHFFNIAKQEAAKSTYYGASIVSIGAVAVYKGTILAKGSNSNKTSPVQQHYNHRYRYNERNENNYFPSKIHAEMICISKIKYLDIDFSQVTIYVYRALKDGTLALAKPCEACYHAICDLGIKHVCYTTEYGYCEEWYS